VRTSRAPSKVDDDSGAEAKVVLHVSGRVGQLGAQPIGLECSQAKMVFEADIEAAAGHVGKAACGVRGNAGSGKDAVQTLDPADQELAEA